ncbi:putative DMBT1-like protein [Fukomys damarensis]|uniref:putative DMBT1-like protein n=1 Tax=Fukomys damarensis TaxID=885580 RepID=UPI001455B98F|nr:putative DMBT1-like protein [Fukomys damarensis]
MTAVFRSDGMITNTGVYALYNIVQQDESESDEDFHCGALLTNSSGTFSSPWYPKKYPTNVTCAWDIQVDKTSRVKLTFEVIKLENFYGCPYDFVEISDGPQSESFSLGRFCSRASPTFTSSSNRMTVVFHSDAIITNTGFLASYESLEEDENDTGLPLEFEKNEADNLPILTMSFTDSLSYATPSAAASYSTSASFPKPVEVLTTTDDVRCTGEETNLGKCHHLGLSVHNCGHQEDAGAICSAVVPASPERAPAVDLPDIRLVHGRSLCEGRVEVYHNGTWGTVCNDLWALNAAHVVCRQLGCGEGVQALGSGHFGGGVGSILLDDVQCQGNETSLGQCCHLGLSVHNCGHHEDAGVICSGTHSQLSSEADRAMSHGGDLEINMRRFGSYSGPPHRDPVSILKVLRLTRAVGV